MRSGLSKLTSRPPSSLAPLPYSVAGTSSGAYTVPPSANFAPFVKTRSYNIPDGLFAEMESESQAHPPVVPTETRAHPPGWPGRRAAQTLDMKMGLFPDIDRAWMTIDNKLLLWNYKERSVRDDAHLPSKDTSGPPKLTVFSCSLHAYSSALMVALPPAPTSADTTSRARSSSRSDSSAQSQVRPSALLQPSSWVWADLLLGRSSVQASSSRPSRTCSCSARLAR